MTDPRASKFASIEHLLPPLVWEALQAFTPDEQNRLTIVQVQGEYPISVQLQDGDHTYKPTDQRKLDALVVIEDFVLVEWGKARRAERDFLLWQLRQSSGPGRGWWGAIWGVDFAKGK